MTRTETAQIARAVKARNTPPLSERFWSKVDVRGENECWPWKAAVRNPKEGYGAFWYKGRHHPSGRIVWLLTHDVFVESMQVCHRCDNPSCCNPVHLFLGSHQDNNSDKVKKKRHVYGEKVQTAILKERDVLDIIALKSQKRASVGLRKEVAEKYNVSLACISDIWGGRSWKHIKR